MGGSQLTQRDALREELAWRYTTSLPFLDPYEGISVRFNKRGCRLSGQPRVPRITGQPPSRLECDVAHSPAASGS